MTSNFCSMEHDAYMTDQNVEFQLKETMKYFQLHGAFNLSSVAGCCHKWASLLALGGDTYSSRKIGSRSKEPKLNK